jgi:hypothetical protein
MSNVLKNEVPRNKKVWNTISSLSNAIKDDYRYAVHFKHWIHWNGSYWENGEQAFCNLFDKAIEGQGIDFDVDKRSINKSLREKLKLSKTNINSDLLLVTPNGTIDIRQLKRCIAQKTIDGECPQWLRPSEEFKMRFITMRTNASYKWKDKKEPKKYKQTLLEDLSNDSSMFDFYNMVDASLLLGGLYHEFFYIYWGPGRNGKTILLNIKREVLGSYSSTLSPYAFRLRKTDAINEIFYQKEKRLIIIDELNRSTKLDTSIIKRISGRNHFASIQPNEENDFTVDFKCIFDTNHLPNVEKEESTGFWERVIIFPFRDVLPEKMRNKDLQSTIISTELDDILTFIVDTYLPMYLKCVVLPPECIENEKGLSNIGTPGSFINTTTTNQRYSNAPIKRKVICVLNKLVLPTKITKAIEYYKFSVDPYTVFLKEACLQFDPDFIQAIVHQRVGMRESFALFIYFVKNRLHEYMELFKWDKETESLYFADMKCSERQFFHSMEENGYYTSILNGTNTWKNLYIRQSIVNQNPGYGEKYDENLIKAERSYHEMKLSQLQAFDTFLSNDLLNQKNKVKEKSVESENGKTPFDSKPSSKPIFPQVFSETKPEDGNTEDKTLDQNENKHDNYN